MNEWLKSHIYIAEWLGTLAGYIGIFVAMLIALFPVIKRTAKSVCVMFAVWLMVSSALFLFRSTMSQETEKEMWKAILVIGCIYVAFLSSQDELNAKSEA